MGIEIRPAWAENVTDVDVALLLTLGPSSLKAGYRWIEHPHESLNGPYAGVSCRARVSPSQYTLQHNRPTCAGLGTYLYNLSLIEA